MPCMNCVSKLCKTLSLWYSRGGNSVSSCMFLPPGGSLWRQHALLWKPCNSTPSSIKGAFCRKCGVLVPSRFHRSEESLVVKGLCISGHMKTGHSTFYEACICIWSVSVYISSIIYTSERWVVPATIYIGYLVVSSSQFSLSSISLTPENIVGKINDTNLVTQLELFLLGSWQEQLWRCCTLLVRGFWCVCSVLPKTKSLVQGKLKEANLA